MSDRLKARREIFTLLHHGLEVLVQKAAGGVASKPPLDGGVELLALASSLKDLPQLCLSDCTLTPEEIHQQSQSAMREVVSWVAPRVHVPPGSSLDFKHPQGTADPGDQALIFLEIGLKILTADLERWVDGEYSEEVLNPSMLAEIFKKVPYQVQAWQEKVSTKDPLVSLIRKVPSDSPLARMLESSGVLHGETMLRILLRDDLEEASQWMGRKELLHPTEKDLIKHKVRLLRAWGFIFPDADLASKPLSWFGGNPVDVIRGAKLLVRLSTEETETAERLAVGFEGTLGELIECARGLS